MDIKLGSATENIYWLLTLGLYECIKKNNNDNITILIQIIVIMVTSIKNRGIKAVLFSLCGQS